jgi:hypothetical protein
MTFQYHDYLDDQHGILLPTPLTFALMGFEKSRHHWNKTILPYLREGIDWLKAPNPRNNNSPTIFYTKSGLLQLCRILNRLDLEPQISAIAPRGGALARQSPAYIQWQQPVTDSEDDITPLPYAELVRQNQPAFAHQFTDTPGGDLVAPIRPQVVQTSPDLDPYIPPMPSPETPEQQGIGTMNAIADIIFRAQQHTAQNIHQAHQNAANRPAPATNVQLKLPSWWDSQDSLAANILYAIGIVISLVLFAAMIAPSEKPQELYPSNHSQQQ